MYPSRENIKEMSVIAREIKKIIGGTINEIMLKSLKLTLELTKQKELKPDDYEKKYYIPKLQGGK